MGSTGGVPPTLIEVPGGAVAGVALRAIAWRDPRAASVPLADFLRGLLFRQADLIASLASPDEERAFDLRMEIVPSVETPLRGNVLCALLCRAPSLVAARELVRDVAGLLQGFAEEYEVEIITDHAELAGLLHPYGAPHFVEIGRREAVIALDTVALRRTANLGFIAPQGGLIDHAPEAEVYHAYPIQPEATTLARLFDVLLHRREALTVSVFLQPTTLAKEEREWLLRGVERCEKYAQLPLGMGFQPALQRQAAALGSVFMEQLHLLDDAAQLVQVRVLSPQPLRASLVEAIAAELSAPPQGSADGNTPVGLFSGGTSWARAEGDAVARADRALGELRWDSWLPTVAPSELRRARSLYDVKRAAAVFRFPAPVADDFPGIPTRRARTAPPPRELPADGVRLGEAVHRCCTEPVWMLPDDRRRHCYVVGQTGTGKTTLFHSLALNDIRAGHGVCVIDPHGDLIDRILPGIPPERMDDVILFDPGERERPIGLNLLEWKTRDEKYFLVQELIAMLYRMFPVEMIGPMFEHNVRNAALTLMADPDDPGTLVEIPRIFSDKEFHERFMDKVDDPLVRDYWEKEQRAVSDFHRSEMLGYLISKFDRFVGDPTMRNIIGQQRSGIDFRAVMDEGKILLVDLGKGSIGELSSQLLGMVVVAKLFSAALQRDAVPESDRRDFYLYVDEFQNLATQTFASILSEARKYRLNLTVTNQYLGQLLTDRAGEQILNAVLGNVGTFVAFRVGVRDAEVVAKQFEPIFSAQDLANLPNWHAYVSLLVAGQRARPFSMRTVRDETAGDSKIAAAIRQLSGLRHGRARDVAEEEIGGRWREIAPVAPRLRRAATRVRAVEE